MDDQSSSDIDERVFTEMEQAAMDGQLERVKELYNALLADGETDEDWSNQLASAAAGCGNLHILQWLIKQNPRFLEDSLEDMVNFAATAGHLHILQWLQQQPSLEMDLFWSDVGADIFDEAAGHGQLHIIQWLRKQDPPCGWSTEAYAQAASSGHLHIIQWLREQDPPCPWEPPPDEEDQIFPAAWNSNHLHVMRWLHENGFHWAPQYGTKYMWVAAGVGDLKALEWAQSQHPPFAMHAIVCAASVHLSVLKWLRTRDPPCPWSNFDRHLAQRAIFIQEYLMRCGLTGELADIITDIVCEIEAHPNRQIATTLGCI